MNTSWELSPEKFLTPTELAAMLRRAEELWIIGTTRKRKPLVRDSFLIHTAILTGLRNSEIRDLKATDLRIGSGQSHLQVRNGKGGKPRTVHFGKDYKALLKRYLQWKLDAGELTPDAHLLRTARSDKFSITALWRRWTKYCPKTLHCARHTNATLLMQASGNNLRAVQKQLGHSRITTTQIYADVMPPLMVDAMCAMERLARSLCKANGAAPALSAD